MHLSEIQFFSLLLLAGACLVGAACGVLVCSSIAGRDAIGALFGRGHLLALAAGGGIYEADAQRALSEFRYASGADENDRREQDIDERLILRRLVSNAVARSFAAREVISGAEIERELNLPRWQFRDEKAWITALRASGLSARSLRRNVTGDLRTRHWIRRQIASHVDVTVDECRSFYDAHLENFL